MAPPPFKRGGGLYGRMDQRKGQAGVKGGGVEDSGSGNGGAHAFLSTAVRECERGGSCLS
jgi:hypothetical protein